MLGKIDSRLGGLRASFDVLPDAPVTKFTMTLRGGEHGIIANATDTCEYPQVATAKFIGQDNGDRGAAAAASRPTMREEEGQRAQGKGG